MVATGSGGSVTSSVVTLTVYTLPTIQPQPNSQIAVQGQTTTFTVGVANGTTPYSYQWNVSGTNLVDGPIVSYYAGAYNTTYVSGSATPTLTLSNVQPAQAGNVFVVVTNYGGSVTSQVKTLTVNIPTTIVTQPQPQAVVAGATATFAAGLVGTPNLQYTWYFNGASLGPQGNAATLTLSSVTANNAGNYYLVAKNNFGSVTSAVVSLTVLVTQPLTQITAVGLSPSFSVGVSSPATLGYQWTFNGSAISGATNSSLALTSVTTNQTGSYAVNISTPAGVMASSTATLTVLQLSVGTVINTSDSGPGSLRQALLQANTNSGQAVIVFQIPGTAPFTISVASLLPVITNSVIIDAETQPGWAGAPVVEVSGHSLPPGTTGDGLVLTASSNTVQGLAIAGFPGNGLSLSNNFGNVIQGNYFGWDLSQANKLANTGNGIMLYNSASNVIGGAISVSGNVVVTAGNDGIHVEGANSTGNQVLGNIVGMKAAGTGSAVGVTGNGIVITNASWNTISGNVSSGNTGDGLDLGGVSATFNVVQGNFFGTDITGTNAAKNSVNGISIVNSSSNTIGGLTFAAANVISGNGGNGIAISGISAQYNNVQGNFIGTDLTGTLNLKNNSYGVNSVAAINNLVGGLAAGADNTIADNGSGGVLVNSGQCAVLENSLFGNGNGNDINLQSGNQQTGNLPAVPPGGIFSTNNTAVSQVLGSLTNYPNTNYRIELFASPAANDAHTFIGATNVTTGSSGIATFTLVLLTGNITNQYITATATDPNGDTSQLSAYQTVNFTGFPAFTNSPQNLTDVAGNYDYLNFIVTGVPVPNCQWYFNGSPLAGATNTSLFFNPLTTNNAGSYFVVATNVSGSVTSTPALVTVLVPPSLAGQPASQTVTQGSNAVFSVVANGTAPFGYQWTFNGTNHAGATAASLVLNTVQSKIAGLYAVVETNVAGSVISSNAMLTVNVPAGIATQPANQTVTQGSNVVFSVTASGTAPFGYQWTFNGTNLVGATSSMLPVNNVQTNNAGTYAVVVTNIAGSVTSSNATLTVNVPPSITTQPVSQTLSAGQNVMFNVAATGTGPLSYQWTFGGANLIGATNAWLTLTNARMAQVGSYMVVVTNSAGLAASSAALVVTNPIITLATAGGAMTPGGFNFQLSVPAGLTYVVEFSTNLWQWTSLVTNVSASDSMILFTDSAATNSPMRFYRVAAW